MNQNPHGYTNLNDDAPNEANAHFSFEQEQSNARHRAPNSGQDNNNSANQDQNQSQGQSQPQEKELSSGYTYFFGAIFAIDILSNGLYVLNTLQAASLGLGLSKLEFLAAAWILAAVIIALMGLWNKDLGKIENALTMMKIHFPFFVVNQLGRVFTAVSLQQRYGGMNNTPVTGPGMIFTLAWNLAGWYFGRFEPTRRIRNTWKTVAQEEEMRQEQAQDADPIEKLDSLKFTVYKYAILLISCSEAKYSIEGIYGDFSDLPKFCEKMMSEASYLVMQLYLYPLFPLSMVITFLAFEGLRRKNLQKILTSIKLLKIHLVVKFVMQILTYIIGYYEGTLKKNFGDSQNDGIFSAFLFVLFSTGHTYVWIYFASQIRDILKAHERTRYTL